MAKTTEDFLFEEDIKRQIRKINMERFYRVDMNNDEENHFPDDEE